MEAIMPHQTTWTDNGCHLTVWDTIDGAELIRINDEMCGSERFDSLDYFVRDLSRIQMNRLVHSDLLEAAYILKVASSYKSRLRGAFIVSDPVTESHVQNYIQQSRQAGNPWEMQIFHDPAAALQWATAKTRPLGQ
jgi:hypothetical protein